MVGGGLQVVEETDEVTILAEGAQEKIGIELSRCGLMLFRQCGGGAGGLAGHHPYRFESHRTPGDMSGTETDGHDEIVHATRQQGSAPGVIPR